MEARYIIKYLAQLEPRNTLKLYNCFYLNEQNIEKTPAHSILFSDLTPPPGWNVFTDDDGTPRYLYSTNQSSLTINFIGSKFWLEGTVGPNLGRIRIKIDNQYRYDGNEFRLYREKYEEGVVYYESKDLPFGEHTVRLEPVFTTPVTFTRLLYNYHEPVTEVTQSGLIRAYSHEWTTSITSTSIIKFSFNGTKVYICGQQETTMKYADVYIDGNYDSTISFQSNPPSASTILYESVDLPFGEHTIEVKHESEITIHFFLYRPQLIYNLAYAPVTDFMFFSSSPWTNVTAANGNPAYSHTSSTTTIKYRFHGTRFWLTGIKANQWGSFTIDIKKNDNEDRITNITVETNNNKNIYSVLLYESPILPIDNYYVTIKTTAGPNVGLCGIITSQQPQDSAVIYAKDMKMNGTYGYGERKQTYKVNSTGSSFQFDYYGGDFSLIGYRDTGCIGHFQVYDNEKHLGKRDITNPRDEMALANLYNSANLAFENHSIILLDSFIRQTSDEKYLYVYSIFYSTYSDDPSEYGPYVEITPEEFDYDENWVVVTMADGSRYIESTLIGSKVIIRYGGSNFTLEGYLGPCNGKASISISTNGEHKFNADVPLYREKYGYSAFFASPPLDESKYQEITIVNSNGYPIRISKVKYNPLPSTPIFTESSYFSNSESFTTSNLFSNSEDFTKSTDFTGSNSFTKSIDFTESISFTNSECFTTSTVFSESYEFTQSDNFSSFEFTLSELFSKSDQFSHSFDFTSSTSFSHSANFTSSELFNVPPEQTTSKTSSVIFVVVGVVAGVIIILLVVLIVLIIIRKRRHQEDIEENSFEANATTMSVTSMTNNDDIDEPNSFASEIFSDKFRNYEEDVNEHNF